MNRAGLFIKEFKIKFLNLKLVRRWNEVPDSWKRTRRIITSQGIAVGILVYQLPIYAALPEAPKMPPLPETGIYPPEIIKEFTEEQFHEAMNPIPFFPNNYRFMVAHQRLKGASIGTRWNYCKSWWESLKEPNYETFLPSKLENTPKLTVSFELHSLIEADYTLQSGWRFRFRRGAQQFLQDLTLLDCEVVLYTTFSFNTLQEMADVFFKKTEGILNLTGGENYEPKYSEGVNYKLFVNSCTYENGDYIKTLSRMNRKKSELLHIDIDPMWVEESWRENCIFVEKLKSERNFPLIIKVLSDIILIMKKETDIGVPELLKVIDL